MHGLTIRVRLDGTNSVSWHECCVHKRQFRKFIFTWKSEDEPGHRSCGVHNPMNMASGKWIPDGGAWQFQGYDENGLLRSL